MSASPLVFAGDGGAVQACNGLYLRRTADRDLDLMTGQGGFAYLLDCRQVGKSSLLISALQRAEASGVEVVYDDLSTVGATEPEHLFTSLAGNLGLDGSVFEDVTGSDAAAQFCEMAVDRAGGKRLLLLLDEVDAAMSCAKRSVVFGALEKLPSNISTIVAGMALPAELWGDNGAGPFRPERRISLNDFSLAELAPAEELLSVPNAHAIIEQVWNWTGGHPYLTMNLLSHVQATGDDVDTSVERLYLNQPAEQSRNLFFVQTQLERGCVPLYRRLIAGEPVPADDSEDTQRLLLSGIAVRDGDKLRIRNRLYQTYFDKNRLAKIEAPGPFEIQPL